MNFPLLKYHLMELVKLIKQEPNEPRYSEINTQAENLLSNPLLKQIKETPMVNIDALKCERKRRQIDERLLKKIQDNPNSPAEVKADIAKALQGNLKDYRKQMKNLRQTQRKAVS
jgi:hypothetical protein